MADWAGVKEALNSRYTTDFGMKLLAGADGFAASVDVGGKKEVILIFNDKPFVTIAGIIGNTNNYNIPINIFMHRYGIIFVQNVSPHSY